MLRVITLSSLASYIAELLPLKIFKNNFDNFKKNRQKHTFLYICIMAKAIKKTPTKKRGEYDEKLKVNASFLDIIKASVKDAKSKDTKKP